LQEKSQHNNTKFQVSLLPEKPGVYQFFDKTDTLLYIGKAKNLKKRVSSYFSKHHESGKTRVLVSKIYSIKHIIVETESDALLLENSLIKQYQPRYNILLKDDKTYPWIVIRNEEFPRIHLTRTVVKDGSEYFGPYTSTKTVKTLLELIRHLYPIRTCKHKLSQENIAKGKFDTCLEYHIGNCLAPCVGKQNITSYNENISNIRRIIKGDLNFIIKYLRQEMLDYSGKFLFEEAEKTRKKLELIENYRAKSTIVNPEIHNMDVFGIAEDKQAAYINFLKIFNGTIIQAHNLEIRKRIEENTNELFSNAILEIRNKLKSEAKDCLVPIIPEFKIEGINFQVPLRGDKKKILDLSMRNAKYHMLEKHKQTEHIDPSKNSIRILETLKSDLHLSELPKHIECFDNSNIQGHYPVAACVVFKDTKPSKKNYRHFNIKTVEGPDDYASMTEVIFRRYKRMLEEKQQLPQLIVVDGGKGQLGAAVKALDDLNLSNKIAVIGIAKRLEEIYFPGDPIPIYLDKNSESLKVIQHARDEAHRFGITFHRNKRSNDFIKSELNEIPGIGGKTVELLLKTFGSVSKIREISESEIAAHIGKSKASLIKSYL
jgi:excinuclease ABC subunit C